MLDIADLEIGDKVRVGGSDTYPRFFNVPGHKKGFVAKGMIGTIERLYVPGECDLLDRSDGRDVYVVFDEPKKWKAHFLPEELESVAEVGEDDLLASGMVGAAPIVDICDCAGEGESFDRVEDFMTPASAATLLAPEMPLAEAARLLSTSGITGAPVVSGGKLVGVLTQFDFLYQEMRGTGGPGGKVKLDSGKWQAAVKKSMAGTVSGAMSQPSAVVIGSNMVQVAEMMLERRFNHVPVVDGEGSIMGILTSQDVLRHVLSKLSED